MKSLFAFLRKQIKEEKQKIRPDFIHVPTHMIYEYDQVMSLWYPKEGKMTPVNEYEIYQNPYFRVINPWILCNKSLPKTEGYYDVKFEDDTEDQKPFRIRPNKGINRFMTEKNVKYWRLHSPNFEPID